MLCGNSPMKPCSPGVVFVGAIFSTNSIRSYMAIQVIYFLCLGKFLPLFLQIIFFSPLCPCSPMVLQLQIYWHFYFSHKFLRFCSLPPPHRKLQIGLFLLICLQVHQDVFFHLDSTIKHTHWIFHFRCFGF